MCPVRHVTHVSGTTRYRCVRYEMSPMCRVGHRKHPDVARARADEGLRCILLKGMSDPADRTGNQEYAQSRARRQLQDNRHKAEREVDVGSSTDQLGNPAPDAECRLALASAARSLHRLKDVGRAGIAIGIERMAEARDALA